MPETPATASPTAAAQPGPGPNQEERAYYALNRRVYPTFAPWYDVVTLPLRHLRRQVTRIAALRPGARLLDLGTGTGAQAFAFAPMMGAVVGLDLSRAMLGIARRKNRFSNVTFCQADGAHLPFPDREFNAACASFVLHEMPGRIRERTLHEVARVTQPGGPIIIVDYGLPHNRIASRIVYRLIRLYEGDHYADFAKLNLEVLMKEAGIEACGRGAVLGGLVAIWTGRRVEPR